MPKQSNRGLWYPITQPGDNPCFSGVRKIMLKGHKTKPYAYAYYSASDNKWFDANGVDITENVASYSHLSR